MSPEFSKVATVSVKTSAPLSALLTWNSDKGEVSPIPTLLVKLSIALVIVPVSGTTVCNACPKKIT